MIKIDIHNYMAYAIDFINNNLSIAEAKAFSSFLDHHPEVAEELAIFEPSPQENTNKTPHFEYLKIKLSDQEISQHNFDEYCIVALEGDLSSKGRMKFDAYLKKKPHLAKEYQLYQKCTLSLETISYPNKRVLIQKTKASITLRRHLLWISSIAAVGIIAILTLLPPKAPTSIKELSMVASFEEFAPNPQMKQLAPQVTINTTTTQQTPTSKVSKDSKPAKILVETPPISIQEKVTLLATLEPKKASLVSQIQKPKALDIIHTSSNYEVATTSGKFLSMAKGYFYSTVLTNGIDRFNRMAETSVGYTVEKDKNGNPVRFTINSRFGEINHTLAQR